MTQANPAAIPAPIQSVIVVGAGTAGLMAALALKRHIPTLQLSILRSPTIGIIGVGESTTPQFPLFLFEYLGLSRKRFFELVKPTWKTGIHFLWGPRAAFEYAFESQCDAQWSDLPLSNGYYCADEFDSANVNAALMAQGKAFVAQPSGGGPVIGGFEGFHLFNPALVQGLETFALERGIGIIDGKVTGVRTGAVSSVVDGAAELGVTGLTLEDGRSFSADLYVDASGFRSELLGKAMGTGFVPYDRSLYCDRAIVGSWERTDDVIYPYTVAETMEAGWCWRIDHEHAVNRGYVYSSRFLSDEAARAEFVRKNPKAKPFDHIVKFRSGRYERAWVGNVFAIGNACGFVEPLEATALMVASSQIKTFVRMLSHSQGRPTGSMRTLYNSIFAELWDNIRDFLALHYRFNARLQNGFWTTCCNEVDLAGAQPLVDFYRDNGPTPLCAQFLSSSLNARTQFGIEGFLTLLVGQKVPYRSSGPIPMADLDRFRQHCGRNRAMAAKGLTVAEALRFVKHPQWQWFNDPAK